MWCEWILETLYHTLRGVIPHRYPLMGPRTYTITTVHYGIPLHTTWGVHSNVYVECIIRYASTMMYKGIWGIPSYTLTHDDARSNCMYGVTLHGIRSAYMHIHYEGPCRGYTYTLPHSTTRMRTKGVKECTVCRYTAPIPCNGAYRCIHGIRGVRGHVLIHYTVQ
jgi:hypothetical protein